MNIVEINPKNFEVKYLEYLNLCFPGWGTKKDFDWVFNRKIGKKKADIIIIKNEEGEVIAGSGITYRKIKNNKGNIFYTGTMTGSWTLPKARGKGCFTQIINLSKEICKQNNAPYLTAFVMETNPSYRRLKSEGSDLINSYTLFSPDDITINTDFKTELVKNVDLELIKHIFKSTLITSKKSQYSYSFEEFNNQYYNKNKNVEILKVNNSFALIEEAHNVIKLNYFTSDCESTNYSNKIISLVNWIIKERGKKLMFFTTENKIKQTLKELGFSLLPGYFTILKTNNSFMPTLQNLSIKMGDKM